MPNELALTFEAMQVRMVMRDGQPWWVLADVCEVLDITLATDAAKRLDDDEKDMDTIHTLGGTQQMLLVSEPGLYKLLQTSRKPQAKRFDRWIRHEVLPEIRKTGSYRGVLPTLGDIGQLFDAKLEPVHRGMALMRDEIAEVRGNVVFLTKRVDDMAPRHDFTANTRRMWAVVIQKFYNGMCPHCRKVRIVCDGTEIKGESHADHFNGRERNKPQDGWLICPRGNYELANDAQAKDKAKPHFLVFQDNLLQMFGTAAKQSSRKRNHSKTVPNKRQLEMDV